MVAPTAYAVKGGVPLAVPRVGLLASAKQVNDAGDRWGLGVEWLPELQAYDSDGFGGRDLKCSMVDVAHDADNKATVEHAFPFQVYGIDWCSTLEEREYAQRAERLLAATRSRSVAEELWTGTIAQAQGLTSGWLASATDLATSSAVAPGKALAKLDQAIAIRLSNGQGMIHCTVETLNRLVQADALVRDGSQWVTAFGNIVVADAGYTGDRDGQNVNTEWMVGTSLVRFQLGQARTLDPNSNEAIYWADNTTKVWSTQDVIVMHEPNLCLVAAQVDLS